LFIRNLQKRLRSRIITSLFGAHLRWLFVRRSLLAPVNPIAKATEPGSRSGTDYMQEKERNGKAWEDFTG
jgi:hypothetical protein